MKDILRISALGVLAGSVAVPFAAQLCRADILFLDMNDSPAEIRAAREAAARLNPPEKVIVFPERTAAQQEILDRIHGYEVEKSRIAQATDVDYQRLDADRTKLARMEKSGHVPQATVSAIEADENKWGNKMNTDYMTIAAKVQAVDMKEQKLGIPVSFDPVQLQKLIDSYHATHKKISSIIFSGHHDFETFTGIFTIDKQQLVDMFKKDPDVYQGVRAVYGWGCYSATPEEGDWWNQMFPNKAILAGFDAGGPASDQPADRMWLEGVMENQERLIRVADNAKTAHDVKLIQRMVHAIPGWGIANTALCTRAVCVGLNTGAIDLSKVQDLCTQKNLDFLTSSAPRFTAAMQASSPACENVPCDGGHSWLRDYYNKVRSLQHCGVDLNPLQYNFQALTQGADSIIRLIDFGEIFNNFRKYYKDDIAKMSRLQQSCGSKLPDISGELKCTAPPAQPSSEKTVTRYQVEQYVSDLGSRYLGRILSPPSCKNLSPADASFMAKMTTRYVTMISSLQCIPLSWVNPTLGGRMPEAPNPSCIQ